MTKEEKVAAAQFIQNKMNGVNAVQQRHALPSVEEWQANGGVIERLPAPGDCFLTEYITVSNYGS